MTDQAELTAGANYTAKLATAAVLLKGPGGIGELEI
jgi:hypothetical protein